MARSSIELRLNSVEDAKASVRNLPKIQKAIEDNHADSIEFLIASEVKAEVNGVIRGAFDRLKTLQGNPVKTFTSTINPRPGNTLFKLPHYSEKPVQIPIKIQDRMNLLGMNVPANLPDTTIINVKDYALPKKKGGRPKGSKNKGSINVSSNSSS